MTQLIDVAVAFDKLKRGAVGHLPDDVLTAIDGVRVLYAEHTEEPGTLWMAAVQLGYQLAQAENARLTVGEIKEG